MDLERLRKRRKELGLTYDDIVELSGISKRTVCSVFAEDANPRLDTVQAIERALGLDNEKKSSEELSEEEKELVSLISQLTEEEVKELSNFVDYIISKRK